MICTVTLSRLQKVNPYQKTHCTLFLKCPKLKGSALLSVCQSLTFVFFEAWRSFVAIGAMDKWRSDFGSKLFISFWVLYWPTSRQSSSDALWRYRCIFLATKTQLDLLSYLTWGRLRPYNLILYSQVLLLKRVTQRAVMKAGSEAPVRFLPSLFCCWCISTFEFITMYLSWVRVRVKHKHALRLGFCSAVNL